MAHGALDTNRTMTRILVIEEDAAIRALVGEWLESAGYGVDVSYPVRSGTGSSPSLVVVSMMNPRGPGAIELQSLRARYARTPLIVLSAQLGHSLSNQSETARSLGVSALLAKPFSSAELLDAVAKALDHDA